MSTVYVTHEIPTLDFGPAYKWGDSLVAVFPPGAGQVTLSPHVAIARARQVLRNMTQDDYLILAGDPVIIGLCVAIAAELVGRVKLLRFDRHTFSYVLVELDFLTRSADATYVATAAPVAP